MLNSFNEYLNFWHFNLKEDDDNCIYIDIPFCEEKCSYCIYNSTIFSEKKMDNYMNYIKKWIEGYNYVFDEIIPKQIYFGGGTASLLSVEQIKEFAKSMKKFNCIPYKHFEGHPNSFSREKVACLSELGFSYFSLGIQSFDLKTISQVRRQYVAPETLKKLVDQIHLEEGIVSVDIIAFLDGYTAVSLENFEKDLHILMDYCLPDIICIHPSYRLVEKSSTLERITILKDIARIVHKYSIMGKYCVEERYSWLYNNLDSDEAIMKWGKTAHNLCRCDSIDEIKKKKQYNCNYSYNYPHHSVFAMGGYDNRVLHSHLGIDNHWKIRSCNKKIIIEKV